MTAAELAATLALHAESLVPDLLPNGKRQGKEWVCGDVRGNPGTSMSVCLTGERAGLWIDWATGERGDMLGLLVAVRGYQFRDACEEARRILGIREDRRSNTGSSLSGSMKQLLHVAAFEATVLMVIAGDLATGQPLQDEGRDRLRLSVSRLTIAREGFAYAS